MQVNVHQGSNFAIRDYPNSETGHFVIIAAVDRGAEAAMYFDTTEEVDALIEAAHAARALLAGEYATAAA